MAMRTVGVVVAWALAAGCSSEGEPSKSSSGGVGASGGSGAAGGGPGLCVAEECEDDNPCTDDVCALDQCAFTPLDGVAPPGTVDPEPGDCMVPSCQQGGLADVPDVGAPCELSGGQPGICDARGQCGCAASAAGDARYVDPVNGVDDATHGGAPGNCAYKTLTYALTQGQLDIVVAPGTYSAATGEALPFILDDTQRILCQEVAGEKVTLTGKGEHFSWTAVIIAGGADNAVVGCNVVGVEEATYCIDSSGTTTGSEQIRFEGNDIGGCLNGIRMVSGNQVASGNTIHDNSLSGIHAQSAPDSVLVDNVFYGNGTDINCNAGMGWPTLTGTGNQGQGGAPSCSACDGCPFQ
jgi:parallel beta-helix repeat protein